MSELIKKLEIIGASADTDQNLIDLVCRDEIKDLIAQNPNICAFEHAPDEEEPSKDSEDEDEDKMTENKRVTG